MEKITQQNSSSAGLFFGVGVISVALMFVSTGKDLLQTGNDFPARTQEATQRYEADKAALNKLPIDIKMQLLQNKEVDMACKESPTEAITKAGLDPSKPEGDRFALSKGFCFIFR